jgi:hypothetical protein
MEEIGNLIFLERSYAGVALGAIVLDQSFLLVDSPLLHADQQSWLEQIFHLNEGKDRVVLLLDTHIDRTVGINTLSGTVLGHVNAVDILANQTNAVRPQESGAGSDVEALNLPIQARWALPTMTFSKEIHFYSNENPIIISHQPGSHLAGCWVRSDAEKLIFVGDSVMDHQPPFLAWCDLETWLDELSMLQSEPWVHYRVISSRSGIVRRKTIEKQAEFLMQIKNSLPDIVAASNSEEAIYDHLPGFLRKISFDKKFTRLYRKRLAFGLSDYLKRRQLQDKKVG